jgi:hypothetical protein
MTTLATLAWLAATGWAVLYAVTTHSEPPLGRRKSGSEAVWCVGRAALQAQIDSGALRNVAFERPAP